MTTFFLLPPPPRETEERGWGRLRWQFRPARGPAAVGAGEKRRREARGSYSPTHLGLGRSEEAGSRWGAAAGGGVRGGGGRGKEVRG
jgi:hypothetical protein